MADCCGHRIKKRSEEEYRSLTNRLSRIEGQIRGIRGMLERDAYCPEILAQAAAANAAARARIVIFISFSPWLERFRLRWAMRSRAPPSLGKDSAPASRPTPPCREHGNGTRIPWAAQGGKR